MTGSLLPLLLAQVAPPAAQTTVNWPLVAGVTVLIGILTAVYLYTTRGGIIARATVKETVRQPEFPLLMVFCLVIMLLCTVLPFYTLGEDVKMMKSCGLDTLVPVALVLAVRAASTSIASEIEGKTAITLLSKPINRQQFIVGKYVGIMVSVFWLMLPIAVLFLTMIYFKVFYDGKEASRDDITSAMAVAEVVATIPGILLGFLEVAALTAISVAISTRLPMVVNVSTILAIYVVGHLTPVLVQSSTEGLEPVLFVARLISTLLPSLEIYTIRNSIAMGLVVPEDYLGTTLIYTICYSLVALLLAFILFEDRDLA